MCKDDPFPERQLVAVLSTAHITASDDAILYALEGLGHECFDAGSHVVGHSIQLGAQSEDVFDTLAAQHGASLALRELVRKAHEHGIDKLRLDPDGPISLAFPTFDW